MIFYVEPLTGPQQWLVTCKDIGPSALCIYYIQRERERDRERERERETYIRESIIATHLDKDYITKERTENVQNRKRGGVKMNLVNVFKFTFSWSFWKHAFPCSEKCFSWEWIHSFPFNYKNVFSHQQIRIRKQMKDRKKHEKKKKKKKKERICCFFVFNQSTLYIFLLLETSSTFGKDVYI